MRLLHFSFPRSSTTAISTLSLHDALPIFLQRGAARVIAVDTGYGQIAFKLRQDARVVLLEKTNARYLTREQIDPSILPDRKSTRLNSSHSQISYAVFCLKKKNIEV